MSEDPSQLLDQELDFNGSGPDRRPFAAELAVARAGVDSQLFVVWIRDISENRVEQAELVRLVHDAIAADKYFLAPRAKLLKSILAKLDGVSSI